MNNFDQCVKKNNNPIINFFHPLFDTSNLTPDEWRTNGLLDPKNLFFTYYGISSFSYTIIGFLIAFVFPNTFYIDPVIEISPVFEGICIMLQTPFTLMADVLSMYKEKSYFHPIDRIVATFNTGLIASNIIFVKWGEKILYLLVPPIGSLILIESRKARDGNNYNEYLKWHTLWHCIYPISLFLWILYRNNIEYEYSNIVIGSIITFFLCFKIYLLRRYFNLQ